MSPRRGLVVRFALAGPLALALGCAGQSASSQASATPDTATEITATCEHVVELARATPAGQDPAVLTRVQTDCKASLAETADLDAPFTSCIRTATSVADIDTCEQATTRHSSVLRGLEPSSQAMCVHVLNIIRDDLGDAAVEPSAADLDEALAKCVIDLDNERHELGGVEVRRQAACVMAADTLPTLMACEPPDPESEPVTASTGDAAIEGLPVQPISAVMANAIDTPNPDQAALQDTKAARLDKSDGISVVEFCIEINGEISDVRTIQKFPDDPKVDQIIRETVAKWRFEPFMLDGKATKTCTQKTFKLKFK